MSVESRASAKLDSCVEGALARLADERFQIVLQIVASSIDPYKLDRLQAELDRFPDESAQKNAIDIDRLVEQITSVAPQIVGLELDRTTPLRILGIGRVTAPVLFAAKCFGHEVTLVGRLNFATTLLVKLFDISCVEWNASSGEFPDGPFDLIISYGGPNLGTKSSWTALLLPLVSRLTAGGRIFVAMTKEANVKKGYSPELVLSKLAQMGARVSSKNAFVLFDQAAIEKFMPAAEDASRASPEPEMSPSQSDSAAEISPIGIEHKAAKPNWRSAALIGSFVILIGLLVATWAGH